MYLKKSVSGKIAYWYLSFKRILKVWKGYIGKCQKYLMCLLKLLAISGSELPKSTSSTGQQRATAAWATSAESKLLAALQHNFNLTQKYYILVLQSC